MIICRKRKQSNHAWKEEKMKKCKFKQVVVAMAVVSAVFLGGCGKTTPVEKQTTVQESEIQQSTVQTEETTVVEEVQTQQESKTEEVVIRVGALKGPTTLGLLPMLHQQNDAFAVDFQMMTAADELLPLLVKGELDIAMIPSNVASVLYQKTQGGIEVIDINTLSVLYFVSGDQEVKTPADLKGKTIYLTGKGTTPDYALHYVLTQNGLTEDEYTLEYKSEATEVAAVLTENPDGIGLLPQPFVTAACIQNDALGVVMDLGKQWEEVSPESAVVTGVTVVRKAFLEENEELVKAFLDAHKKSALDAVEEVETTAAYAVEAGIVAKEPIAMKAIPQCNIVCITGKEMQTKLAGYLEVLFKQNPEAIGGAMPEEDFYYVN